MGGQKITVADTEKGGRKNESWKFKPCCQLWGKKISKMSGGSFVKKEQYEKRSLAKCCGTHFGEFFRRDCEWGGRSLVQVRSPKGGSREKLPFVGDIENFYEKGGVTSWGWGVWSHLRWWWR